MPVTAFNHSILFKSVRNSCEMTYSMLAKRASKRNKLTSIIKVEMFDGKRKLFFKYCFELRKNSGNLIFKFHGKIPTIFGVTINK